MVHDPDRRFRNEPDRVESEELAEPGPRAPEPSWLPETNSGRAAMAGSVRAWRSAEGAGKVARGAQAPVAQAMSSSGGRALDARAQAAGAQAGFGDLSGVQVHTDAAAADAAASVGAKAFAVGSDIFFGAGYYQPGTDKGDELLGHELAHTAQQRGAGPQVQTKLEVSSPGESMEVEADQAGSVFAAAARGQAVSPVSLQSTGQTIARDVESTGDAQMDALVAEQRHRDRDRLTDEQVRGAIAFNRGRNLPATAWATIATIVGSSSSELDRTLVQAIAKWQDTVGLQHDGRVGDITMQWLSQQSGGETLGQHVRSNDLVYLGMNQDSRGGELRELKNSAAGSVTGAIGERQQDTAVVNGQRVSLTEDAGLDTFLSQFPKFDAGQQAKIREFLKGTSGGARDELAQLVKIMYQAETGQRLMKRVVMSGHSGGTTLYGNGAEGQSINFTDLFPLMDIFPMALGQVEDLMLSACNTGFTNKLETYRIIFPNLKSIWAYVGYSPAYGSGAERHIGQWEKSSRGSISQRKMDAARETVGRGGGKNDKHVALWTLEAGPTGVAKESYATDSEEATYDFDTLKQSVDLDITRYFEPAYGTGEINQQQLNDLYGRLQALCGQHSGALGADAARYEAVMKKTLYLRHWSSIARNFMETFGDKVRAAYRAASTDAPAYATLSRTAALGKITAFPGDKSSEGYKLLTQYLRDLDPSVIPDAWN